MKNFFLVIFLFFLFKGYETRKGIAYVNRFSITGPKTVLESIDVQDWLVLRVKDGATSNEVLFYLSISLLFLHIF